MALPTPTEREQPADMDGYRVPGLQRERKGVTRHRRPQPNTPPLGPRAQDSELKKYWLIGAVGVGLLIILGMSR